MPCMSCINYHFGVSIPFIFSSEWVFAVLDRVNNNISTLYNHFQNGGSESVIIICKLFPFKVLSLFPTSSHTIYLFYSSLLRVFKLNTRFFSSRIKAGERTKPTQIRELSSPGQRGVFLVLAELTTPGAATRRSAQIELTAVFYTESIKSWLASNCVMWGFCLCCLYWEKKHSFIMFLMCLLTLKYCETVFCISIQQRRDTASKSKIWNRKCSVVWCLNEQVWFFFLNQKI